MEETNKFYEYDKETGTLNIKFPVDEVHYMNNNNNYLYSNDKKVDTVYKVEMGCIKNIIFPESIKYIGISTFLCCENLENIEFTESLKKVEIEFCAFQKCLKLKKIKWNNSKIIKFGEQVFGECKNLKEIQIPVTVCTIGENVFCGCENLEKIYVPKILKDKICDIEEKLKSGNSAKIIIVENDFDLYKEEKQNVPKKVILKNTYCGSLKPNLLTKRKSQNPKNIII